MTRARRTVSIAALLLLAVLLVPSSGAGASKGSYRFYEHQTRTAEPVRWNPCAPIHFKVNANRLAGPASVSRVRAAVAEASAATGIRFRYAGTTRFVPDDRRAPVPDRIGADLVITWAHAGAGPRRSALLPRKARLAAVGGFDAEPSNRGFWVARSGFVVFSAGRIFAMSAHKQYVVALHELGHVLGLDHVSDRRQVMNGAVLERGPAHYATGDRLGLRRLGRRAGCLAPAPAPARPRVLRGGRLLQIVTPPVASVSGRVAYTLTSPQLGGQVAEGPVPRFALPLRALARHGLSGREIRFVVRAANRVGASTSVPATYRVPPAALTVVPRLVASPNGLDLVAPRAVLAGTSVDVSDLLRVHAEGTVVAFKQRGGSYSPIGLYEHIAYFGGSVTRFEVIGTVTIEGPGLSRVIDLTGTYLTGVVAEPPAVDPLPEPPADPEPPVQPGPSQEPPGYARAH